MLAKKKAELKMAAMGKRLFINEALTNFFNNRSIQSIKGKRNKDPNYPGMLAKYMEELNNQEALSKLNEDEINIALERVSNDPFTVYFSTLESLRYYETVNTTKFYKICCSTSSHLKEEVALELVLVIAEIQKNSGYLEERPK